MIDTANGPLRLSKVVTVDVPELGKRGCYVLRDAPTIVSLGALVEEEGYRFLWTRGYGAIRVKPDDTDLRLNVVNRVPVISKCNDNVVEKSVEEFVAHVMAGPADDVGGGVVGVSVEHTYTHMPTRKGCPGCVKGKMTRKPARMAPPDKKPRAKKFLDRLHTDII